MLQFSTNDCYIGMAIKIMSKVGIKEMLNVKERTAKSRIN